MANNIKVETPYLKIGMFVSELDMPWDASGFALQGFLVTEKNIQLLREKCEWVTVLKSHSVPGIFKLESKKKLTSKNDSDELSIDGSHEDYESFLVYLVRIFTSFLTSLLGIFGIGIASNVDKQEDVKQKQQSRLRKPIEKTPKSNQEIHTKQDALSYAKTLRASSSFVEDDLLTHDVVEHVVVAELAEEYKAAQLVKKKLEESIGKNLFEDAFQANAMNVVLNETKESVGGIVESMLRNPDAMRLVDNIKAYDNLSYKHAVDVCILMIAFGRELQLPKETLVELGLGGLLHDIGEVKPISAKQVRLRNIAMFQIYKSHVVDGIALVKDAGYSDIVKAIIAEHHERYNGSGYPYGLSNIPRKNHNGDAVGDKSTKICMYGLMIAVVDTYVSMISGRNCKNAIAPSVAMSYIMSRAGIDFDPAICDAFVQVIGVYPIGVYVQLNTGEIAIVIKQNRVWRLKPVVKVIMNSSHERIPTFDVDLIDQSGGGRLITKEVVFET
jgi:putative nucleotidyltransferase with HDIG domain